MATETDAVAQEGGQWRDQLEAAKMFIEKMKTKLHGLKPEELSEVFDEVTLELAKDLYSICNALPDCYHLLGFLKTMIPQNMPKELGLKHFDPRTLLENILIKGMWVAIKTHKPQTPQTPAA